jgi:hypothetical protein
VKSADGAPPDPTFVRVLCYTFGGVPSEHHIRIHKDDTHAVIREGLEKLHLGVAPAEMLIEGAVAEDDCPMADWMSRTGKSDIRVNWKMEQPYQKFWIWTPTGEVDLGDEPLDGRQPKDVWASLRIRSPTLGNQADYRIVTGQREVCWKDIPVLHLVLVQRVIPTTDRGTEFHLIDLNSAPAPRDVGPLIPVTWQLFTNTRDTFAEPVDAVVPNEITLAQLVATVIFPHQGGGLMSTQFSSAV